ncbi:hypothetical protein [Streptomyces sp. NPDC001843]|uniref:hypothetical protein n=1 Tax=Streptomyces sp. NPDC001843 TaxID=3364617 RepID=UPI00369E7B7B
MAAITEVQRSRSVRGRVALHLFRWTMVLLVLFFTVRTYDETAIAVARGTGGLDTVDATVVEVRDVSHEGCSGSGQDTNCDEKVSWFSQDVTLRVGDGGTRTVSVDSRGPSFAEGRQVRLGLWHDKAVEIDGYVVHSAWTGDGFFFVVPVLLYPLAMGYVIVVAVALLARVLGRGGRARLGVGDRFAAATFGVVAGLASCVALIFFSAARDATPAWWPIAPVGAGSAVAALMLVSGARKAAGPSHG